MSPAVRDSGWFSANQDFFAAALAVVRSRLTGGDAAAELELLAEARLAMPAPPALESIGDAFGLSAFERDVLLLCCGVELDAGIAGACGTAGGEPQLPWATFGLAMTALPEAHWSAITPAAALRRWQLVELTHPESPASSPLRIDERILNALAGISYLDTRIESLAEPLGAPAELPPSLGEAASRLAAAWAAAATGQQAGGHHRTGCCLAGGPVRLHGRQRGDLRAVAATASAALGLRGICLRAADLPAAPVDREFLARLCERETVLTGLAWLVEVDGRSEDDARLAIDFAVRLRAPVAVAARTLVRDADRRLAQIEVAPAGPREQRDLWRHALGAATANALGNWVDRIAGQFDLGVASIAAAASEVVGAPGHDSGPDRPDAHTDRDRSSADRDHLGAALWDACRRQARPAMDSLAQRVDPHSGWDDLVLPETQLRTLREIVAQVRHRLTVLEDWGLAGRSGRGLGVAALFAGASGTGKTLAAEVLASDLRLDLYRVDLSQVVSKYIGETEKNLSHVFDAAEAGGAVLLFDEADALFGKRSEVRDSHDRHANIEVGYLLQRMETFRGLAILTTNLHSALDAAFLRRLRFIVRFPFPDAAARAEIWRGVFPSQVPTEGLDAAKLARLAVSGGAIRNIALSAAFLAAEAGEPVRMSHLRSAARSEYLKLDKSLTETEVAGWTT